MNASEVLIKPQTQTPYADTEPFPGDFLVEGDDQPPQERDWS